MTRHPLDLVSLVSGAVFVLFGILWFAAGADDFAEQLVWAGPAALAAVGATILVTAARPRRT